MRKRPSGNAETSLLNQALTSGVVSQHAENSDELEKKSTVHADKLMDELLALGYYPKAHGADQPFQLRLSRAEKRGEFNTSQMETIEALKAQAAKKDEKSSQTGETSTKRADDIMDEIRSLGYYPKEFGADRNLGRRRRAAERNGEFSTSQKEELDALKAQATKKGAKSSTDKSAMIAQPGETSPRRADDIMDEIRSLGSYPREFGATRKLAHKRRKAEAAGEFSISQLEEQKIMRAQQEEKARTDQADLIMKEIRALGYIPKRHSEQSQVYKKYNKAVKSNILSSEQIGEAEALTAAHTASLAQSLHPPPEACAPPDPLDAFAEEAANRLEQDLLMASSGMRTKQV